MPIRRKNQRNFKQIAVYRKVYTTALKINKVAEDGTTALTGAKFQIEGASSEVYKINGFVFQEANDGTFYRMVDGTYTEIAPTETTADKYESTTQKYAKVAVEEETSVEAGLVNEGWVDANGEPYALSDIINAGKEMVDRQAMRRNEWRDWLNMPPDADMEELIALENYILASMLGQQKKLIGGETDGKTDESGAE